MPTQQSRPEPTRSLGSQFGIVAARLAAWTRQRSQLSADLQNTLRMASSMLRDLGVDVEPDALNRRAGGRPKGYRTSEATRRKLRAAWKRRKAATKSEAR